MKIIKLSLGIVVTAIVAFIVNAEMQKWTTQTWIIQQ